MSADTITAVYEKGLLRLRSKTRLPFRVHEVVTIRVVRKPDPIEGTRGVIVVSPRFARELTTPHKYSALDR